jgi:putative ABC transport system permease protein
VIVDSADLDTLGVDLQNNRAGSMARRGRLRATGLRGLGGVNVLASLDTARHRRYRSARGQYLFRGGPALAGPGRPRARPPRRVDGPGHAGRVLTAPEFASRSQQYWLFDTGAGIAVLFMAVIVCFVGAVITNQSFASVVAGSVREYATLNALGAGRYALARVVFEQALLIGGVGMLLAAAFSTVVLLIAQTQRVPVQLTPMVIIGCVALVAVMAMLSSIMAVRSVVRSDPSLLLR